MCEYSLVAFASQVIHVEERERENFRGIEPIVEGHPSNYRGVNKQ